MNNTVIPVTKILIIELSTTENLSISSAITRLVIIVTMPIATR
jgi:hypothetical protein